MGYDYRQVAYMYAARNGANHGQALAFVEWACGSGLNWKFGEHVDSAHGRYVEERTAERTTA